MKRSQDEGLVVKLSDQCVNNKHVQGKIYAREIISNIHYTNHNTTRTKKKNRATGLLGSM